MEDNYSIDEILSAVKHLQSINRNKNKKISNISNSNSDNSEIPKNTLKLIEEAEKSKS